MSDNKEEKKSFQEERLSRMSQIQNQAQQLNDELEKCIELVSSSIVSVDLLKKYETMKTENRQSFYAANDLLDGDISQLKNEIVVDKEKDETDKKSQE